MPRWARRRFAGALVALVLGLTLVAFAYGLAGWIGGMIPVNREWRQAAAGVEIFVEDNGIHTGIALPKGALGIGWDDLVSSGDLRNPAYAAHPYLVFGWGDRAFYLGTPTWGDLSLKTTLHAAIGSEVTVLHVEHVPQPVAGRYVRRIVLREEEFRRLSAFIRASFDTSPRRLPPVPGYGEHDAFYTATGRYSAVATCNEWTGRALRHAGVRVGAWTPFSETVMRWF